MNNEEKILSILEALVTKVDNIEAGQVKLQAGQTKLEDDVSEIKDSLEEIRSTTNRLVDWAERAEPATKVKLFPNVHKG